MSVQRTSQGVPIIARTPLVVLSVPVTADTSLEEIRCLAIVS